VSSYSKTINQPPSLLWAFYWYFIRPIWPAFALLVFLDFLAALTEVALASFVAILIDLMRVAQLPVAFIGDHAGLLIAMGFFVIVVRPTLVFGYELVKNQVLSPPFQTRPLADASLYAAAKPWLFSKRLCGPHRQ
jgi:ATP-binding cassette subfamily B multidrug efflux pump